VATALMPVAWVVLYFDLQAARIQEVVGPRGLPLEYAAGRAELLSNELVTGAIDSKKVLENIDKRRADMAKAAGDPAWN